MQAYIPSTIHVSSPHHLLYDQHVLRVNVRTQAQTVIRLHYTVIFLETRILRTCWNNAMIYISFKKLLKKNDQKVVWNRATQDTFFYVTFFNFFEI